MFMVVRRCTLTLLAFFVALLLNACEPSSGVVDLQEQTPGSADLEFRPTDPSTVRLATGRPQLVEIYSYY